MKTIKRKRINGALIPFTLRRRKKYPFRTPVPALVGGEAIQGTQSVGSKSPTIPANSIGILLTDLSLSFEEK
jgi:hypothetical protein